MGQSVRSMTTPEVIYKICAKRAWDEAVEQGEFAGAPVDLADGFIHFSTAAQVAETAARHFRGQQDLVLITVDARRFGDALKWEPSRGGALFPHLYGPLPVDAAISVAGLALDADGVPIIPLGLEGAT